MSAAGTAATADAPPERSSKSVSVDATWVAIVSAACPAATLRSSGNGWLPSNHVTRGERSFGRWVPIAMTSTIGSVGSCDQGGGHCPRGFAGSDNVQRTTQVEECVKRRRMAVVTA